MNEEKINTSITIQLLKKILVVFFLLLFLIYLSVQLFRYFDKKNKRDELQHIYKNGVSQLVTVSGNKINRKKEDLVSLSKNFDEIFDDKYGSLLIEYSFSFQDKTYNNKYQYNGYAPHKHKDIINLFTVHYLKNNPDNNYLNIYKEIKNISISEKSTIRIVGEFIFILIIGIILLYNISILLILFKVSNRVNKKTKFQH